MDAPQPPYGQQGSWPQQPPPPPSPYQQQPPQPHQPPHLPPPNAPHPPWGPPARPPVSGLAIAGFVTALVGLFPLALVFGLIALIRLGANNRAERGKGLAVAAVTLAGIQIAALAVVIPVAVINAEDDDGRVEASERDLPGRDTESEAPTPPPDDEEEPEEEPEGGEPIDVFDIRVGDCFDSGTGLGRFDEDGESAQETTVTRLACDTPHEAEAFGSVQVQGYDAYPGDAELTDVAFDECGRLVQPFVIDTWALDISIQMFFYYPQQASWALGDREILCFFGHTDGSPLTESQRGDESELSPEQVRYLEITTPLEITIWNEPLPPDATLPENQAWAGEMSRSITTEMADLAAERWSQDIAGEIDELIAAREESVTHWDQAAAAPDMAAYNEHYQDGYATLGVDHEVTIRETLGLATGV
jgi:putative regulator of septum formation